MPKRQFGKGRKLPPHQLDFRNLDLKRRKYVDDQARKEAEEAERQKRKKLAAANKEKVRQIKKLRKQAHKLGMRLEPQGPKKSDVPTAVPTGTKTDSGGKAKGHGTFFRESTKRQIQKRKK